MIVPRNCFLLVILFFVGFVALVPEVQGQSRHRVKFEKGSRSAILRNTVRGYDLRYYVVRATAGQTLSLDLTGTPVSPVLTVFTPNNRNLEGAIQVNDSETVLSKAGDYVIRVGLMRAVARRKGSLSQFTLKVSVN